MTASRLEDLVSYAGKHNEANGEDNRDGTNENFSSNCGAEGQSGDPAILALRARQKRNLIATLLFSQGVPMLIAGDELGRTQKGNNNAYCQDNETSWLDWDAADRGLVEFVRLVLKLRAQFPVFRRTRFFDGDLIDGTGAKDIAWLHARGAGTGRERLESAGCELPRCALCRRRGEYLLPVAVGERIAIAG